MTTFNHVTLSCERIAQGASDYFLQDAKQRAIGFKWGINLITSKHYEKGDGGYYPLKFPETTHYRLWTTVTRDGMTFGASTPAFHAVTREEIDTEINRRAEVARIRYTKKFGPAFSMPAPKRTGRSPEYLRLFFVSFYREREENKRSPRERTSK